MPENNLGCMPRKTPYSIEAEQSVLGCVLISNAVAEEVCSKLKEEDFYSKVHKTIYDTMQKIYYKNQPVDYVTLVSELEKQNKLNEIGGLTYITTLTNTVPSAANYMHYVDIVSNDSKLRKLLAMGEMISSKCYDGEDVKDILNFADKELTDISTSDDQKGLVHISTPMSSVEKKFETIAKDPTALRGVSTGFYGLDKLTNGLQKGDLVLIAARPGVGKTSLAMNIINHAALVNKSVCAVFSLEMPKEQLAQRSLCSIACVSMEKALKGDLSTDDWTSVLQAKEKFVNSQIYVDDSSLITPLELLSKCRKLKREHGLDLIMIDYVQLMNATTNGKGPENRQQEISSITRILKIAAKELEVPILLLSQLSRAVEIRSDHRPMLSDLRESGAIEQDADIVMFIYNPDMYADEGAAKPGIVDLIVAKHRNGGLDTIKLRFNKENTSFLNLTTDSEAQSLEKSAPQEQKKKQNDNGDSSLITPLSSGNDIIHDVFK